MEEKIEIIDNGTCGLITINKMLEEGWKVKMITPFLQPICATGQYGNTQYGNYGAYVVLERQLIF